MSAECGICYDNLQSSDTFLTTPCGHVFHKRCLMEWLGSRAQSCPQCRSCVTATTTRPIYLNFSADDLANVRNLESRIVNLQRTMEMKDTEIAMSRTTNQILTENIASRDKRIHEYAMQIRDLRNRHKQLCSELKSKTENAKITLGWLKDREEKICHLEHTAKIDNEARKLQIETQCEQQNKLIKNLKDQCAAMERSKRKLEADLEKREKEMEVQNQQDKLIEELTARCSALERSKRKLISEVEKRVEEITILKKSRAKKEKELSSTELVSEERGKDIAAIQEGSVAKEKAGPSSNPSSKTKRAPRKALATVYSNSGPEAEPKPQRYFLRPR